LIGKEWHRLPTASREIETDPVGLLVQGDLLKVAFLPYALFKVAEVVFNDGDPLRLIGGNEGRGGCQLPLLESGYQSID